MIGYSSYAHQGGERCRDSAGEGLSSIPIPTLLFTLAAMETGDVEMRGPNAENRIFYIAN